MATSKMASSALIGYVGTSLFRYMGEEAKGHDGLDPELPTGSDQVYELYVRPHHTHGQCVLEYLVLLRELCARAALWRRREGTFLDDMHRCMVTDKTCAWDADAYFNRFLGPLVKGSTHLSHKEFTAVFTQYILSQDPHAYASPKQAYADMLDPERSLNEGRMALFEHCYTTANFANMDSLAAAVIERGLLVGHSFLWDLVLHVGDEAFFQTHRGRYAALLTTTSSVAHAYTLSMVKATLEAIFRRVEANWAPDSTEDVQPLSSHTASGSSDGTEDGPSRQRLATRLMDVRGPSGM